MRSVFINIAIKVTFCSLIFVSCGSDPKSLLCNKWKSVALRNPQMDNEIAAMKLYIDTVGNQDEALRKQINIDSFKTILQGELDQAMKEQQLSLENTLMEFKSNGIVYTTSIQGEDSAMYSIDDENNILIEEAKLKGYGETMKFQILSLTKDSLQLKMIDYGDTSYVTMVPVKS
ncbi:MAG: hypothetical protein IT257_01045 [Chitinophagaceae bacterium]|nr:hypothetical protein [Chitinophagaceae bacterium]